MKYERIRVLFVIFAFILVLPVAFSSCFAPEGENSSSEASESEENTDAPAEPSGYDYVLTEEDLAVINAGWITRHSLGNSKFRFFSTLEDATQRKSFAHYFGKYGNTFVIWRNDTQDEKCCFTIEGFDFDFYIGVVWFISDGKWYDNTELPDGIFTPEEAKDFHDNFTEHYLPLVRKEYAVLEYISGLEILSEEEMKDINDTYEQWFFDAFISHYSEDKAAAATKEAYRQIGYDPHRFFNDSKFEEYHYYGKIGGKVFIAAETTTKYFTAYDTAGYRFVYAGKSSGPLVYADGVVTELSEAYRKGIVSDAELAEMHERYLAYYYYFAGGRKEGAIPDELMIREYDETYKSPIELHLDEIREIAWEYIDSEKNLKYAHGVRCYGKFESGAYAVMVDGPYMYLQALETERVAGYEFYYNNSQKIRIYCDGIFYSMNEAYLMGIISESDVASVQWNKTVIQN